MNTDNRILNWIDWTNLSRVFCYGEQHKHIVSVRPNLNKCLNKRKNTFALTDVILLRKLILQVDYCIVSPSQQPHSGLGRLIVVVRRPHTQPVGLLWASDQLVAEAATYTTHNTIERYPRPQRDSHPQSQQSNGRQTITDERKEEKRYISFTHYVQPVFYW